MSWSWTLYRYLALQFLMSVMMVYGIVLALVFSGDVVNLLNRTAGHGVDTGVIIGMAVLQLPDLGQQMLPFAILFGGVFAFMRLSRSQELVAARAAGISAWDFLMPALAVAITIGILTVTVATPVSSKMFSEFSGMEARYIKDQPSQLAVSENGLWLRQGDESGQSVIHALGIADQGEHLENVIVFLYGANDKFSGRIEATSAQLVEHYWLMRNAWVSDASGVVHHHDTYQLATTLDPQQIQNSFQAPETLSFWQLPGYIRSARAAGFSATRDLLYLYTLYSLPALFAAMVLMGASFSLRSAREGGSAKMLLFSAAAGFSVYFFQDLTLVLGRAGTVPVLLAATAPAIASLLIGMTLVFSREDG